MLVDTLSIARDLRAADLPAGQAEAIAAAIGRSVNETVATKTDLDGVRKDLKTDIDNVRKDLRAEIDLAKLELKADIERSRNQLLLWFFSTQVALGGLMIALIKL